MSKKLTLLDDSSDSEIELTINKSYAKSYNQWRNKEELQKYKDLRKEEDDSESSSSESDEEIPEFDEEFFRALSLLKSKDPRLYDKDIELFKNQEVVKKPKAEKQKPVFMKDYERNLVLERGGKFSDEEDEPTSVPEKIPTYDEEQEKLKKSFKEAVGDLNSSDDDDADDLLQVRTKTKKEEEEEEKDYIKWLKGEEKEVPEDVKKDMSYLRNYWNDPELDENEKFLKDYLLNKRYLEKDESEIPTFEELTSGRLSDDEKMIEEQEKFEHKYNFRFEEPDEDFIKRYPRTVGDSLRRADTRRKQKREEKAERRQKEREQRREELKRLKALKRKEIEEKFLKIKEISGQEEIKLNESDMESDFDPDKHDQKMREMFNDEYYEVEEDKKPEFPYDEELDAENWNAWAGEKIVDDEDEEENEEGVANEESGESSQQKLSAREEFADEMINASRPKKKVKKKSLFAKIISQPKPIYDPDGKSFEEYLDEYYKLDYEDVVGDLPVRYKYRKVIPNDFGLTVDEILKADDRELNRWCSVKKTCQYRRDEEELYDVQAFQKKAQNPVAKQKFLPSVYAPKEKIETLVSSNSLNSDEVNNTKTYDSNDVEEDNTQLTENSNVETVSKEDSTTEIKKKRKKKNRKKKKKISADNTELTTNKFIEENGSPVKSEPAESSTTQVIDTAMDCNENFDSVGSTSECTVPELTKKNSNRKSDSDRNNSKVSPNLKNNSQSSKRKRDAVSDDSEENDSENGDAQESAHELLSQPNNLPESNAAGDTSEMSAKKKQKKKKNKRKKLEMSNSQGSTPNPNNKKYSNPNRNNDKHKQNASGDKRLGLSDARLAAYGINPKKFKNKIIYSKK